MNDSTPLTEEAPIGRIVVGDRLWIMGDTTIVRRVERLPDGVKLHLAHIAIGFVQENWWVPFYGHSATVRRVVRP